MKVAVSAQAPSLEAPLDPRFGRCAYFVIVDTDTMRFEAIDNAAASAGSGAGILAAQTVANAGAEAVIGQGSCVNPQILAAVQERFEAGDDEGAIEAQYSVNLLVRKSTNTTVFLKRYATEKGFPVKPCPRAVGGSPYQKGQVDLTEEQYQAYKALLESEIAKFSDVPA